MKNANTIPAIILFVAAGCGGGKQAGSDDLITIDVTRSYPKKELILQDFMDVEYVPLETTDEFITAGYVQAIGKEIIIVRNTNQAGGGNIFIYDRSGKGLRKINRRGQSNEEYTFISGLILLDEDNGEMFVDCGALRKIMVYDLFGNFKRSFEYMDHTDESGRWQVYYGSIYSFDRDNLICEDKASGHNFMGKTSEGLVIDVEPRNIFWIISKQDGSVTREIQIPFKKKIFKVVFAPEGVGGVSNTGLIPDRGGWILTETSSDTIYRYLPDHTMRPFIVRTPSIQSMDPKTFLYPGVLTDRYYFLQTVKLEYDGTDPGNNLLKTDLLYDREEKKIFKYIVYNDDFIDKRPLKNLVHDVLTLTVVNNEEVAFMEKIDAYELVEAYREGKLKGKLKEIAATLDEEDNPVIMLAKHKKQ